MHAPEALEHRIAPAAILVQPAGYSLFKDGSLAGQGANELLAKTFGDATATVLLAAGDKLVFDTNGNQKADAGEFTYLTVTTGKAMVFLNDTDHDGVLERDEITALVVGGGFGGTITGDLGSLLSDDGGIATALDDNGALVINGGNQLVLQKTAITSLTVTGTLVGSIFAGSTVSKVKIGASPALGATIPSVQEIRVGSQADGSINLGTITRDLIYMPGGPADGGSITDITLANGAVALLAGGGDDVSAAPVETAALSAMS